MEATIRTGAVAARPAAALRWILPAGLLAFALLWLVIPKEFNASDPLLYSEAAYNIASRLDFGPIDLITLRLSVVLPVALFYKLFGVSIATTTIWPLCAALIMIVVVWYALPDIKSRLIGLALCLVCELLIDATLRLYADVVGTAFMAASVLFLVKREQVSSPRRLGPTGVAAATALVIAMLAKETSYWVLPLWVFAFVQDVRRSERAGLRSFWVPAIAVGTVLGVAYLIACSIIWGDPLARLQGIESLTAVHLWSWEHATTRQIIARMTVGPPQFFTATFGALFVFGVAGAIACPREHRYWAYYLALCLGLFWFGSASLQRYQPLPFETRMITPALPGLIILAALLTSRMTIARRPQIVSTLLPAGILVALMAIPFLRSVANEFLEPRGDTAAMTVFHDTVMAHPDRRYLLITADRRSATALKFFFQFEYPRNLVVVAAQDAAGKLDGGEDVYVYIQARLAAFLTAAYGAAQYPDWSRTLAALRLPTVVSVIPVTLSKVESDGDREKLRAALRLPPRS